MEEKQQQTGTSTNTGYSVPSMKLYTLRFSWTSGIVFQGYNLIMAWLGRKPDANYNLVHLIGLILLGISAYLIFTSRRYIGQAMSRQLSEEDPRALKSLGNGLIFTGVVGYVLLIIALFVPRDVLLGFPNIFRNLYIMTGSFSSAAIVWSITCVVLFVLAYFFSSCAKQMRSVLSHK